MRGKGWICLTLLLLSACSMTPKPFSIQQRFEEAKKDLAQGYSDKKQAKYKKIDFYQALARGLKYNLDYRIKLANTALQMGQLDLAEFTMFPSLNASGSIYSRNNELSSSSVTNTGQISDISNSTPNTVRSLRTAISWNILDFGLSYVKAKEQADKFLIAQQEARKQLQQLAQDILTSYWEAYSAQQLITQTKAFQAELNKASQKVEIAVRDLSIPRENLLTYQEAILDGKRRLIQLQYKYDKAMYDLKRLLSLPPDQKLILTALPHSMIRTTDLSHMNFEKLDAVTLVSRPELWGQGYQKRIATLGVKTAILQALPGITLNEGWNYNSNKFLLNLNWLDQSLDLAWNLLNVASLPTAIHSAKDLELYEQIKQMALTLGILTETRYAFSRYQSLRNEYYVAKNQTQTAYALYELAKNREEASLASSRQVILARIHALTKKMDEDLLLSDLSKARGELYLSAGFDMLPLGISDKPLPMVIKMIKRSFALQNKMDFKHYVDYVHHKLFHQEAIPSPQKTAVALVTLPVPWHAPAGNITTLSPRPFSA